MSYLLHYRFLLGLLAVTALPFHPVFAQSSLPLTATSSDPAPPNASDTIATAMEDLQASDADRRKGAVMLLAKYPRNQLARRGLRSALQDPTALVRRAAAVSLIENQNSLTPTEARSLLLALNDPDPEVRLTVASAIEILLMQWRRFLTQPDNASEASEIRKAVLAAMDDEQAIVRRRIIEGLRLLPPPAPVQQLRSAMEDASTAVRMAAYETASRLLPAADFARAATDLHPDSSPQLRLLLANLLANRPTPEAIPLLRELIQDEDQRVADMAGLTVYLIRPQGPIPEDIRQQIRSGRMDPTLQQRLLFAVRSLPTELQRSEWRFFLAEGSARLARQAAQHLLNSFSTTPPTALLLDLLAHPDRSVRATTLRYLENPRRDPVASECLKAIPDLPYPDVRRKLPDLAASTDPDLQIDLALQLLIDEEPPVRIAGLKALAQLQPPQWPRILKASLRDPDPTVKATARRLRDADD